MASIQRKQWIKKYKRNNTATIAWVIFDLCVIGLGIVIVIGGII